MLEAGNELRLGVEATHELRRVGNVRTNRLDRDLPSGSRLLRGVAPAPRTFADELAHDVYPRTGEVRLAVAARVLAHNNRSLDRGELARRLEPGILGQPLAVPAGMPQRLRLTAAGVERLHQQHRWNLAQRLLDHERFEIRDRALRPIESDLCRGTFLPGDGVEFIEPGGFGDRPPLECEVAERLAAPQAERRAQAVEGSVGQRALRSLHERNELVGVARRACARQPVPGTLGGHVPAAECRT